jgi:hypothetical protein
MDVCPISQNFSSCVCEHTIKEINPKRLRGTGEIVRRCQQEMWNCFGGYNELAPVFVKIPLFLTSYTPPKDFV